MNYVYGLFRGDELRYVGCTSNVERRADEHLNPDWDELRVLVAEPNRVRAEQIEQGLIHGLRPTRQHWLMETKWDEDTQRLTPA